MIVIVSLSIVHRNFESGRANSLQNILKLHTTAVHSSQIFSSTSIQYYYTGIKSHILIRFIFLRYHANKDSFNAEYKKDPSLKCLNS